MWHMRETEWHRVVFAWQKHSSLVRAPQMTLAIAVRTQKACTSQEICPTRCKKHRQTCAQSTYKQASSPAPSNTTTAMNMALLLKSGRSGKDTAIAHPKSLAKAATRFSVSSVFCIETANMRFLPIAYPVKNSWQMQIDWCDASAGVIGKGRATATTCAYVYLGEHHQIGNYTILSRVCFNAVDICFHISWTGRNLAQRKPNGRGCGLAACKNIRIR